MLPFLPVAAGAESPAPAPFKPDWASIASQYQVPEWYRDAKFGVFIHWGVYSVPAYHDEWYPRWMYKGDGKGRSQAFDYHVKTYGPQNKFGYKDFGAQYIGPRADGTIPDEPRDLLLASGAWLKINGEAICGSRPAAVAGEGPTQIQPKGPGRDKVEPPYGSADFRFTRNGDTLFAISLGWPDSAAWTIHSFADQAGLLTQDAIKDVRLLGYSDKLEWKQTAAGLEMVAPHQHPCEHACVFKIITASLLS